MHSRRRCGKTVICGMSPSTADAASAAVGCFGAEDDDDGLDRSGSSERAEGLGGAWRYSGAKGMSSVVRARFGFGPSEGPGARIPPPKETLFLLTPCAAAAASLAILAMASLCLLGIWGAIQ